MRYFDDLEEAVSFSNALPSFDVFEAYGEANTVDGYLEEIQWYADIEEVETDDAILYGIVFLRKYSTCGRTQGCFWTEPSFYEFNSLEEMLADYKAHKEA